MSGGARTGLLLLATLMLVTNCDYSRQKGGANRESSAIRSFGKGEIANPDFKVVRAAILAPRCWSCHTDATGNKGGANLETYSSVRARAVRIGYRSLELKDMPPGAPLSADEQQLLETWLNAGVPETIVGPGEKPDPGLLRGPDNWAKVRDKIFAKKCTACHAQPDPEKGLDLTDYNQAVAKAKEIFDRVIVKSDMPLAPFPAVSPAERKILVSWFNLGMPQ